MRLVTQQDAELAREQRAFTLHNLDKLPGNKGIELIKKFEPTLREYMRKHGGIMLLNKPIYAGMSILDLSKLHMYHFHYDTIKKKYGEKARLLFTDTDSLCYHIKTDDIYADIYADKDTYDLSGFDPASPYYDETNKKVLGKFKDETDGKRVTEFVGLRPKMYSLLIEEGKDEKGTAKGIPKTAQKRITHVDYKRCLLSDETEDKQQLTKFRAIRSNKHKLKTLEIQKIGLSCFDNKRWLKAGGVESYAYGHWRIEREK